MLLTAVKRKAISVANILTGRGGDYEPGSVIDSTSVLLMDESHCEDEFVYTSRFLLMLLHLMEQIKPNSMEQIASSALGQSLSNS